MKYLLTICTKSSINSQLRLSYFDIIKAIDNFSNENLFGVGSYASIYKGTFSDHRKIVTIKVLKVQHQGAIKSFFNECHVLKNMRHRNILKIITICSNVNYEGNDFKTLVFKFMSNGGLDKWLHPVPNEQLGEIKKSSFMQRLNVAIDVASTFE